MTNAPQDVGCAGQAGAVSETQPDKPKETDATRLSQIRDGDVVTVSMDGLVLKAVARPYKARQKGDSPL
jgi:hypothetical protein